jgi:hypothetical protein
MSSLRSKLALFIAFGALGATYGFVSYLQNRNPYYEPGASPAPIGAAWGWEPSPCWLPSYLLCVVPDNGFGITKTRSGYLFRDAAGRRKYMFGSVVIGSGMGLVVALGVVVVFGASARPGR